MEATNQPESNGDPTSPTEPLKTTGEETPPAATNCQSSPDAVAMPSAAKAKYDWYQTESDVIIAIMVKKASPEDVQIEFTDSTVSATIKLPSSSDYSLELDLAHAINPTHCRYKVLSTKIEIKMRKAEGLQWSRLEAAAGDKQIKTVKQFQPETNESVASAVNKYPSSSHYTRNWDQLVTEIKEEEKDEKPEGGDAMTKLLKQIYGDASEETRRAMNKSFVESGGTVLSTNWKEVGKGEVEMKPPDGMEYKKYEQ